MVQIADEEKRESILVAARNLFLHYGFKKTSVEEIAREAGIAKGTVYLYFKTKKDILVRLGVEYLQNARDRLLTELNNERDPAVKLGRVLRLRAEEIFNFVSEHPHAIDLFLDTHTEEDERQGAGRFYQEYMELLKNIIQEGIQQGVFRPQENLDALVFHICYMSQVFQPPYRLTRSLDELLTMVQAYTDTLVTSLRAD